VAAARETGGIVTVEEHTIHGGLGSAVAEACLDNGVAPRGFCRVALREGFSAVVGSQDYLRARYNIDGPAIAAAAESVARASSPTEKGGLLAVDI
jgi:transketolase